MSTEVVEIHCYESSWDNTKPFFNFFCVCVCVSVNYVDVQKCDILSSMFLTVKVLAVALANVLHSNQISANVHDYAC